MLAKLKLTDAELRRFDARLYWRGNTIWCNVTDPDGRTTARGKPLTARKSCFTSDHVAAKLKANEYERCAASPDYAASRDVTLGTAIADLLADLANRGVKLKTQEKVQQKLGHFLRLWGAEQKLSRITGKMMNEYTVTRQKDAINKAKTKFVSKHTISNELTICKQMVNLAIFNHKIDLDIAKTFPPNFFAKAKPKKAWPTRLEAIKLVKQLMPHRAAMVLYMIATGARLGEAERAEVGDVNYARKVTYIHGTKTEKSEDEVAILDKVMGETLLTSLLLTGRRDILELSSGKKNDDVMTSAPPVRLFTPWGKIQRDLENACKRAGIPKYTPNDFRRAFVHWHLNAGVPREMVFKMTRHEDPSLLDSTYGDERGEELVPKLEMLKLVEQSKLTYVPKGLLPPSDDGGDDDGGGSGSKIPDAVFEEFGGETPVSNLYEVRQTTGASAGLTGHESSEKQAPPAGIEPATRALGKLGHTETSLGKTSHFMLSRRDRVRDLYATAFAMP